jgi:hypothetical protein
MTVKSFVMELMCGRVCHVTLENGILIDNVKLTLCLTKYNAMKMYPLLN